MQAENLPNPLPERFGFLASFLSIIQIDEVQEHHASKRTVLASGCLGVSQGLQINALGIVSPAISDQGLANAQPSLNYLCL